MRQSKSDEKTLGEQGYTPRRFEAVLFKAVYKEG